MVLKSSDDKTLKFDFDEMCGINPEKESHMHALTIRFDSPDSITLGNRHPIIYIPITIFLRQ